MLSNISTPTVLLPEDLDQYLSKGWFRMGQSIFTTNFLHFNKTIYSALWLRYRLFDFNLSAKQQKLCKQNSRFRIEINKLNVTEEKEALYAHYKSGITFETSGSLEMLLALNKPNIFNSQEICLYDGDKLIGMGVFDLGQNAAQGIVSFYDPSYKKYSLGKYLILQKVIHAKAAGLTYFYPGYYAPGYPSFDYKLDLAKELTEYYDTIYDVWLNVSESSQVVELHKVMHQNLLSLSELMLDFGIPHVFWTYDFFDINMVSNFNGQGLFDSPFFIELFQNSMGQVGVIYYDLIKGAFGLMVCNKYYQINELTEVEGHYNRYILRPHKMIFMEPSVDGFMDILFGILEKNRTNNKI